MAKRTKSAGPVAKVGMDLNVMGKVESFGTNILQYEVPPELERTVDTGIAWYNDSLAGGYTPSCVQLLTGSPGAGKTTFATQLADALTSKGHVVLFSGTEEAVVQVRKVTKRLELLHGFMIDDNPLIDKSPNKVDKKTGKNADDRVTVLDHARFLRGKHPDKQLVIIVDSIQSHDDGWYPNGYTNRQSQVRVAERIAAFCKSPESGFAIGILIGQVNKSDEFAGPQQLKHAIDMHSHIKIDVKKDSATRGKRLHMVEKNRFGCTGQVHVLNMTRKGMVEEGLLQDFGDD